LPDGLYVGRALHALWLPCLRAFGDDTYVGDTLDFWNCPNLDSLPSRLRVGGNLDLHGLGKLKELPPDLVVGRAIDVAGSGLAEAPGHDARLLWNGVPVSAKVAFHPETLSVEEILCTSNVQLRQVMLERFTHERFVTKANPEVLDADADRGGERRLLRIRFPHTEVPPGFEGWENTHAASQEVALVCLSVHCPSTGALYILRVPPDTSTCRQAAAWIAGFDAPDEYKPEVET
jgi:hypothetical protein